MMVQSPKYLSPTNSGFLPLLPISQEIVPVEFPCPFLSSLFKSWSPSAHKKLELDDSVSPSDGFSFKFACGESSEEKRAGAGGGSPSRRGGKELVEAGEEGGGGGGASGAASSSPSQEEEEQHRGTGGGGGGRRGGRRGGTSETRHPVFRGVRKRQGGRWVSEIREPGKKSRIWLGTFPTPEMAARAYDTAAFNLKRPYAYLNFPESASSLPLLPLSCSPKHIQEAAAAAAAAFASIAVPGGGGGGHVPTSQQPEPAAAGGGELSTSMSTPETVQELNLGLQTASSYFDEDIIFDMPNVLTDMAEGLMMTPPLLNHGNLNGSNGDNDAAEPSLWDH